MCAQATRLGHCAFLHTYHCLPMCSRTLKTNLWAHGITRRKDPTPIAIVRNVIWLELNTSSGNEGYRDMHRVLKCKHHLIVSRSTVMKMLADLDPIASVGRRGRRLTRKTNYSKGPKSQLAHGWVGQTWAVRNQCTWLHWRIFPPDAVANCVHYQWRPCCRCFVLYGLVGCWHWKRHSSCHAVCLGWDSGVPHRYVPSVHN